MPDTKRLLTVRAGGVLGSGGFFVAAETAREALTHMRSLEDRGLADVHARNAEGRRYEREELERIDLAGEGAAERF